MNKVVYLLAFVILASLSGCKSNSRPSEDVIKDLWLKRENTCLESQCYNKIKWVSFEIVNSGATEFQGKKGVEVVFNGQIELIDDCMYYCQGGIEYTARVGEKRNYQNKKIFMYKLDKGWELIDLEYVFF